MERVSVSHIWKGPNQKKIKDGGGRASFKKRDKVTSRF